MNPFSYTRAVDPASAVEQVRHDRAAKFLAGGTNLIDLVKSGVEQPAHLVDINRLPLTQIEELPNGGLRIDALVSNTDVASNSLVRKRYPMISEAILSGATPQLRNMATTGGNLMQRTRCYYFADTTMPCNKREPGSGCAAIEGYNRIHAILGASDKCIATHPSDMCVTLMALDAIVRTDGPLGERSIPFGEFHLLPGDTPERETVMQHGELITAIDIPLLPFARNSHYLKLRDRTSYAFALVSVAAALEIKDGAITQARVVMGGVAHKPWHASEAEQVLVGAPANVATFRQAAEEALTEARPQRYNAFKIELAKRAIVRALSTVAGIEGDNA